MDPSQTHPKVYVRVLASDVEVGDRLKDIGINPEQIFECVAKGPNAICHKDLEDGCIYVVHSDEYVQVERDRGPQHIPVGSFISWGHDGPAKVLLHYKGGLVLDWVNYVDHVSYGYLENVVGMHRIVIEHMEQK